jgi:hypothetical protein
MWTGRAYLVVSLRWWEWKLSVGILQKILGERLFCLDKKLYKIAVSVEWPFDGKSANKGKGTDGGDDKGDGGEDGGGRGNDKEKDEFDDVDDLDDVGDDNQYDQMNVDSKDK